MRKPVDDEIEYPRDTRPRGRSNIPVPDPSDRTTIDLHREVASLKELLQLRMKAIEDNVILRRQDVNSALSEVREAAKAQQSASTAAILHSEAQTKEVFGGLNTLLVSKTDALDSKINLINGRLDKGEGLGTGHDKDRATTFSIISICVAIASLVIGFSVALFSVFGTHTQPQIEVQPPATVSAPVK